jgi:protein-disulfide isomerase
MAAGVQGTPTLFINGRVISGAVPFSEIKRVIDDELAREQSAG